MKIFRAHSNWILLSRLSRLFCPLPIRCLSYSMKLLEVPDVCSTDEWNSAIQDSRAVLQKYLFNKRKITLNDNNNLVSISDVIRRLQKVPFDSGYLINVFERLLLNTEDVISLIRWPGLITLMLSKGVGNPFSADNFISKSLEEAVFASQTSLAEIVNIFHCSLIFRRECQRLSASRKSFKHVTAIHEIQRLVNSYFTSVSVNKFMELQNCKVIYLLSDIIEFLAESNAFLSDDIQMTNRYMWEHDLFYQQGMLLASGCKAALELSGHDELTQNLAYEFGHSFSKSLKANADIQQFWNYQTTKSSCLNFSSLPVILYIERNPDILQYIYSCGKNIINMDVDELNNRIFKSTAIDEARNQLEDYLSQTLNILEQLTKPLNDKEVLKYLIKLVHILSNIREK